MNNLLITTFTDEEHPYTSGRVGLYSEDAEVYFDNVSVSTATVAPPAPGKGNKGKKH